MAGPPRQGVTGSPSVYDPFRVVLTTLLGTHESKLVLHSFCRSKTERGGIKCVSTENGGALTRGVCCLRFPRRGVYRPGKGAVHAMWLRAGGVAAGQFFVKERYSSVHPTPTCRTPSAGVIRLKNIVSSSDRKL